MEINHKRVFIAILLLVASYINGILFNNTGTTAFFIAQIAFMVSFIPTMMGAIK